MPRVDRQALELDRCKTGVQAEDLCRDGLQPALAVCQVRARQTPAGAGTRSIDKVATCTYKAAVRTDESNTGVVRSEGNHVLVGMHALRGGLRVVGHVGEVHTCVRGALDGTPVRRG